MDTLIMQDDSVADRTSMSDHPFHSQQSPRSTNPFEKANKNKLLAGQGAGKSGTEGPEGARDGKKKNHNMLDGSSIKS